MTSQVRPTPRYSVEGDWLVEVPADVMGGQREMNWCAAWVLLARSKMTDFSGYNVLVIGGSRGMGAAIVRHFAAAGANVRFTYAASRDAAERLARDTGAEAIQADAAVRDALILAVRDAGPTDILIYNAGLLVVGDPLALEPDDVDRMIDVNTRGAYHAAVEAARAMPDGGCILLIGSDVADSMPWPGLSAYAMTKASLQGLTRGLARDLGPRNITVNVVQPGPTDTDMNPADGPLSEGALGVMAIKRYGTVDEVASLVLYLAGPQARGISGSMHTIDGGFAA